MKTPQDLQTLVDSTLANLSPITRQIMAWPKGKFMPSITYASKVSPAAEFKDVELTKQTTMQVCAGKDYSELAEIREAIAAGERGEVQAPKGRTWEHYPFTLTSDKTGERLVRLYPVKGKKPQTRYFVNNAEVSKQEFAAYLQPAKARDLLEGKKTPLIMFDKKESELIGLGELA